MCAKCGEWNRNEPTAEKPRADPRCGKCREDRVFPVNLTARARGPTVVSSPIVGSPAVAAGGAALPPARRVSMRRATAATDLAAGEEPPPAGARPTLLAADLKKYVLVKEVRARG